MADRYNPKIIKTCKCGTEFKIYPYRMETALYCSRKCTSTYRENPLKGLKFPKNSAAKLGKRNPNYGHSATKAQKSAASLTMKRLHAEGRFTPRIGALNNRWKGGITPINDKIRKSKEYKTWRTAVFQRDQYTCTFCGVNGVYVEADHILRFADYPELRLELSNGRTLCKPCHSSVTKSQTGCKTLERNIV